MKIDPTIPAYDVAGVCTWLRSYVGHHAALAPLGVELAEALSDFVDMVDAAADRGELPKKSDAPRRHSCKKCGMLNIDDGHRCPPLPMDYE